MWVSELVGDDALIEEIVLLKKESPFTDSLTLWELMNAVKYMRFANGADVIIDQAVFCCSACQSVPVPSVQLRLMRECPLLRAKKSAVEASCNVNNITKLLILLPKRLD